MPDQDIPEVLSLAQDKGSIDATAANGQYPSTCSATRARQHRLNNEDSFHGGSAETLRERLLHHVQILRCVFG